jgi:hypothetical protein
VTPLVARSLASAGSVPLGLMAMLVLYALTLRRAVVDLGRNTRRTEGSEPSPRRTCEKAPVTPEPSYLFGELTLT